MALSPEIPSRVTDRNYICIGQGVRDDEEWKKHGKWSMIHDRADLAFVDRAWDSLRPLVEDGTLVYLKASTAGLTDSKGSAVMCYPRSGKEEARRSAVAIRRAVDYEYIIHYKLNEQTDDNVAKRFGHCNFTIYLHTYRGYFYTKDADGRWIPDQDAVESNAWIATPWRFPRHLGFLELPSKSDKNDHCVGQGKGPYWFLYCRLTTARHERVPEADRIWAVAVQLLREGVAKAIFWRKIPVSSPAKDGLSWRKNHCRKSPNMAKIHLFVSGKNDCLKWLEYCDRLFEKASTRSFAYYYEVGDNRPGESATCSEMMYTYKYTYEGELYERGRFVMQNTRPPSMTYLRL